MEDEETCNTALRLGLGVGDHVPKPKRKNNIESAVHLDLSFTLCPREETIEIDHDEGERPCYKSAGDHNKSCDSIDSHGNNGKKKLRLTKEQLGLLEDSFKHRTTLNPAQKRALAEQLKLKPRQVEVWFQNRRARNKLKQTEVDCEFLKKWCETLKEENGRLQKELQELRTSLEIGKLPLYLDGAKHATIAMCASCEKIAEKERQ